MQCQAASNVHYVVLGSFQRALRRFSRKLHCFYTILQLYLLKLYIITKYLAIALIFLTYIPYNLKIP